MSGFDFIVFTVLIRKNETYLNEIKINCLELLIPESAFSVYQKEWNI